MTATGKQLQKIVREAFGFLKLYVWVFVLLFYLLSPDKNHTNVTLQSEYHIWRLDENVCSVTDVLSQLYKNKQKEKKQKEKKKRMFSFTKQSTEIKERIRFTMLIYVPLFSSLFFFIHSKAFRSNHCCYSITNRLLPSTRFYMTVSFIDFSPSTSAPLMCTPFFFRSGRLTTFYFWPGYGMCLLIRMAAFFLFFKNNFIKKKTLTNPQFDTL